MERLKTLLLGLILLAGVVLLILGALPEGRTCLGSLFCIEKVRR